MAVVSSQAIQPRVTTRPLALPALIVAAVLAAVVTAGAFAWTSSRAIPTGQAGSHLLDPALIQVRTGERTTNTLRPSRATYVPDLLRNHLLDPALIDLRRGERARLDRITQRGNRPPDRIQVHVGKGPLAGGQ